MAMTYSRRRTSCGRNSRIPRAGRTDGGIQRILTNGRGSRLAGSRFARPQSRSIPRSREPANPRTREPAQASILFARGVRDPQLLQVGLVPGRVVVVLPHLRPVAVHHPFVQEDCRLVVGPEQRLVLLILRLHGAEV